MTKSALADVIRPGAGRGLDFVNLDELRKRTGVTPHARAMLKAQLAKHLLRIPSDRRLSLRLGDDHKIASADSELPIAFTVAPCNENDKLHFEPLLERVQPRRRVRGSAG